MTPKAHNFIDLTGRRFSRLTVIKCNGRDNLGSLLWECQCDCGKLTVIRGYHLRKKAIRSCGCLKRELTSTRMKAHHTGGHYTHHGSNTRLYQIWTNMKTRCLNPNNRAFKWYGAVGITICAEWLDFKNFQEWALQSGYQDNLTIERRNPFGNYEPSNCAWIPKKEQRKNQRRSKQWQNSN